MNTRRYFLLLFCSPAWLFGIWWRASGMLPATAAEQKTYVAPLFFDPNADERFCERYFRQPLNQWLRDVQRELPRLAYVLAGFERRGVQAEQPATWYRQNYVGAIPWRPGVALLYAFGRQSEARLSFDNAATWLDEHGVPTIAVAWSDDRRAWTRFVIADRETLAPIVSNSFAPLSTSRSTL